MSDIQAARQAASLVSAKYSVDVYLYNGFIGRLHDLRFIELIDKNKKHDHALLLLVTDGGDPDAGYKIARYLQSRYEKYTVLISGLCKSAGTLIAIGAHELAFSPYGELGPLDIQTFRTDNLAERQSGLVIKEALNAITADAVTKFAEVYSDIIRDTNAIVSFQTASKAAAELVQGLFAPIFAQIDPYDVGDKNRSMRIATEYGSRLTTNTNNLKPRALDTLTSTYPAHSFVIDISEARLLFENVRQVTEEEAKIVDALGDVARFEQRARKPVTEYFQELPDATRTEDRPSASTKQRGSRTRAQKNSGRTKPTDSPSSSVRKKKKSRGNGKGRRTSI